MAISVLGFGGWTAAEPGGEGATSPASANPPAATPGTQTSAKQPQVVLLADGRVIIGVVSEEDGMVIVTQPIGVMRFPGRKVEKVFASLKEVYAYKLEQFPENDFDERINLAKWCLSKHMEPEAREQLEAILQMSPKHPEARAMLLSLDQAKARLAMRRRDPAVRQTAAEEVRRAPAERPGVLDASIYSGALRGMGIPNYPVIFDLPQPVAMKRFDEFGRYVHPVLQKYCARCHNERYEGSFQLISFKNKIDRTPAALRANLDATLQLVDRDNPAHSDLLSSALRPHGRGPNPRPIFKGSNDGAYQILATWINRLQSRKPSGEVVPASLTSDRADSGEAFARDRGGLANDSIPAGPPEKPFATGRVEYKSLPPMRAIPGQHRLVADTNADPDEFPLPVAAGEGRPQGVPGPERPRVPQPTSTPTPRVPQPTSTPTLPPLPSMTSEPAANARVNSAAGLDTGSGQTDTPGTVSKKPSKPIKLDPKLLQRALQMKNQYRTPPGTNP
ncbi:MAG: hypothetical protein ACP5XB_12310 [Isosphaeraceae bacterium]